jgi:hypothetical protein
VNEKANVSFDEVGLRIDGREVPLIAGEYEYWRANPVYWETTIEAMKAAGLEIVSTFICWDAHERELGRFDFSGETDPALDLPRFMDLCAKHGMQMLFRTGPIIDAEWPSRGAAVDVARLERLEPEYLRRTAEYFDRVCEILVPRQVTNGGPVVMVCVDNEIFYPYVTAADADAEADSDRIEVLYRREFVLERYRGWLAERFGSVEALNERAGTGFGAWEEVGDPDFAEDPHELTMLAFEHLNESIVEVFGWHREELRRRGVELPLYCNMRLYHEYIDWAGVEGVIESSGNQSFATKMVPPGHEVVLAWSHFVHRARSRFPWSAEFQSGIGIGMGEMDEVYGLLPPEHSRYWGHLATAFGQRGGNFFMFVERDSWHWCPLTPLGRRRAYHDFVVDHIGAMKEVGPDRRLAGFALVWSAEDHRSYVSTLHGGWTTLQDMVDTVEDPKEWPNWWRAFETLYDKDWDFEIAIPEEGRDPGLPVWVFAGHQRITARTAEGMVAHVRGGGSLLTVGPLPDEPMRAGEEVAEALAELAESERVEEVGLDELEGALGRLGAVRYGRSLTPGCRSFSYEGERGRDLWVVNPATEARTVEVELDEIAAAPREFAPHHELELAAPAIAGKRMTMELPAKTVRAFRFERGEDR